ncbi:alpha/beta hydrolase [Microbispora sp. RL4-1S]|uniref:Alpha/beta hydrolase n=1 Tax=Microbispora oryzae TaxID=2806554 RepID=A0A940WSW8_9ACTN|nr:alpha/beta hydrolase [Microbispora oryzae]MBP2706461.1 alpha/beta hydrolase [Microbispora oryzae]
MRPSIGPSKPRALALLAAAAVVGLTPVVVTGQASAASPTSAHSVKERMPAGFSEHKVQAGSVGINYVIGGHGPTLVLIHGYPQTWYEWRHIMPALAKHYTVIAPDLPGAGRSDAPAAGYDKKTMAGELHALLVHLGRDKNLRIVGHDIGTMVAYSYAAAHPADVRKLVLSEAPIPDPAIYSFPSLTADGPGAWHFGFFALGNSLPEDLIRGRETLWTRKFIEDLEVKRGAVTPDELSVFAGYLRDKAHLKASLAWFRTLPQDMKDDAVYRKHKLTMPVLAIGASGSLGSFVPDQVKRYAKHVTGIVVPDSGHWLYEEQPAKMTRVLLDFLRSS